MVILVYFAVRSTASDPSVTPVGRLRFSSGFVIGVPGPLGVSWCLWWCLGYLVPAWKPVGLPVVDWGAVGACFPSGCACRPGLGGGWVPYGYVWCPLECLVPSRLLWCASVPASGGLAGLFDALGGPGVLGAWCSGGLRCPGVTGGPAVCGAWSFGTGPSPVWGLALGDSLLGDLRRHGL